MKKRIIVVLVVVCMTLFGSMAFAGDDWQDGFAKALDENNLAGALMLAYNSHASPQVVHEALEAFGVGQEDVKKSLLLCGSCNRKTCKAWLLLCCPSVSPGEPTPAECEKTLPSGCLGLECCASFVGSVYSD